jgi:hypothetical protein
MGDRKLKIDLKKINKHQAITYICVILLSVMLGNLYVNQPVLKIEVGDTWFALGNKQARYIITQVDTTYCLTNGITGVLDYRSTNKTLVEQIALENLASSGGLIYLTEVTWATNLALTNNVMVIETYQGQYKLYTNQGKFLIPQLGGDPSTTGWGLNEQGRLWYDTANHLFKFWNGTAITSLFGTQGPQGPQGPQGSQGPQGPQGSQGPPGVGGGGQGGYSYLIFTNSSGYYAQNGATNNIDYYGTNAAAVINSAIENTPQYNKVILKGAITITDTISITKPINFEFDEIILDSSLSGNGIEINAGHSYAARSTYFKGNRIEVNTPNSWNKAAILFEDTCDAVIEVGMIKKNNPSGIGIEWYALGSEYIMCSTIQNTAIMYFDTGLYIHGGPAGDNFINGNKFINLHFENNINYNIKIYNNGGGTSGNIFIGCLTEPPLNSTGYNIWIETGPNATWAYIDRTEFDDLESYDITSEVDYHADSSVRFTRFIGGMVHHNHWQDSGRSTTLRGVCDMDTWSILG